MAPNRDQDEQARRLGIDLREVRQTIRDCWERADNGASFRDALADDGLTLAKGDRRDYIVIDHEGGMHALGKRILGTTAAETRARMADLDREHLPSVEKAREHLAMQRETQARPAFADLDSEPARNEAIRTEQVEQFVALDMPPQATTAKSNEIELTVIATTTVETLESAPAGPLGMLTGLAEGINDGLKMFGAITALFGDDKPAPPPTKEIAIALKQERLAHAERLLHEREYRRQLQREQEEEKQRRAETERKREDDERERTRQR